MSTHLTELDDVAELHEGAHECSIYDHNGEIDNCRYVHDSSECTTLRLLALPWRDHPDWRQEWTP